MHKDEKESLQSPGFPDQLFWCFSSVKNKRNVYCKHFFVLLQNSSIWVLQIWRTWGVFCVSVEEQIFVNPPNHHLSFSTTDLMSQLMWRWQNKIATIFCRQQGQIFLQLSTIFLWLWFFADSLEQYFFDCQPGVHPLSQSWLFSCALWSHAKSLQCIVLQRRVCPCC